MGTEVGIGIGKRDGEMLMCVQSCWLCHGAWPGCARWVLSRDVECVQCSCGLDHPRRVQASHDTYHDWAHVHGCFTLIQ